MINKYDVCLCVRIPFSLLCVCVCFSKKYDVPNNFFIIVFINIINSYHEYYEIKRVDSFAFIDIIFFVQIKLYMSQALLHNCNVSLYKRVRSHQAEFLLTQIVKLVIS